MQLNSENKFKSLTSNIGKLQLRDQKVLIPAMNRIAGHLMAAAFRSFGVQAEVLETYQGLHLGQKYTSGKECFPCQVTLGDILYFIEKEQKRLGDAFDPRKYLYFLPESDGPCRFGMYNKYQRIVLDSLPGLDRLKIASPTAKDGYSMSGLIDPTKALDIRKVLYFAAVVADVLDRLLWRIRPYEKQAGAADQFMEKSLQQMEATFETFGSQKNFSRILDQMEVIIKEGKKLIDPDIPRKPLIGIVGEIFLRMHVDSNQDLIRKLENHGAEVVNASLAEWVNYVSYAESRKAKRNLRYSLKQLNWRGATKHLKDLINYFGDLFYQQFRQNQIYKRAHKSIDVADEHNIAHLEDTLKKAGIYSFDITTEACLSVASILNYVREGCNGVVNVYPFTCMPSLTTSSIVKPVMKQIGMPYLDMAYDASIQPDNESTIRTFMYQANQHFKRPINNSLMFQYKYCT